MIRPLRLLRLFPVLAVLCQIGTADPTRFTQDRFAIGLWVPPRTTQDLPGRYREIREAHFNLVIGTSGFSAEEQIRVCEAAGLKVLVDAPAPAPGVDPAKSLPEGPACWGYSLADEPGTQAFEGLAARVAALREQRPGRLGYINLFPNYAGPAQLGATSYEDYVRQFLKTVKPDVLSMDHYPQMRPGDDSRTEYLKNLEVMRRHSVTAGIPFWNFFHSMPFGDRIDPTEAQIRWMIHASIAHGAKGVMWFCYWTPGQGNGGTGEFPKGGALLTAEGRRTRHYDEARRINAGLERWGPVLMRLTGRGVTRYSTGNPELPLNRSGIRSVQRVGSDPDSAFLIGTLDHADGRRAVLLVNHSTAYTAWPTVVFDTEGEVREVSRDDGLEHPAVDDSPELKGLQVSLGPGDARLFLFPPVQE
jgi:hypothetical protein